MRKPISPGLHGALDYGLLSAQLSAPALLGLAPRARALFALMGVVQGGLNAVTDQPLAVRRAVPFRLHGLIEKSSAPLFVALPLLTGVARDRSARAYWLGTGAVLVAIYNLTDWDAGTAPPARRSPLTGRARQRRVGALRRGRPLRRGR